MRTPHTCPPACDARRDPVESIAALTLPVSSNMHPCRRRWRRRPARAVVMSVADLTLPYRDRGHAVQERSRHVMPCAEHWRWTAGWCLLLLGLLVLATLGECGRLRRRRSRRRRVIPPYPHQRSARCGHVLCPHVPHRRQHRRSRQHRSRFRS